MGIKKKIVVIDDYYLTLEMVEEVLKDDYEVNTFKSFEEALPFIERNKPDLIISDLVGHDDVNGIESYLYHIMKERINFCVWSGSYDLNTEEDVRKFGLFLQGMPKEYRITFDPSKALSQKQVDILVEEFKTGDKETFVYAPKGGLDVLHGILKRFELMSLVIIYLNSPKL